MMMIFLSDTAAAEEKGVGFKSSTVHLQRSCKVSAESCLNLAQHQRVSPGQVKHHIPGSKLSSGWNQRWNPLLYFHLHPFCPTRTCCRGNNKSTSLFFFSCASPPLTGFAQLPVLLFFSTGPKKTWKWINQCQELTLSSRRPHITAGLLLLWQEVAH